MYFSIDFNLICTCEVGAEREPLQMKRFLWPKFIYLFIKIQMMATDDRRHKENHPRETQISTCSMQSYCHMEECRDCQFSHTIFHFLSTAKRGDNVLGSVLPSVCSSVSPSVRECKEQRAKKSHYHTEVLVCVSSYHADAVDRLLIFF